MSWIHLTDHQVTFVQNQTCCMSIQPRRKLN